jgi:hypothetical protein
MDALEVLFLEDSRISGSLAGTDGWPSLGELDVSNDMLSGDIPGSLFQHLKLAVMDMATFSPRTFHSLKHLYLSFQRMAGTFPDTLKQLTNFHSLTTSGNDFEAQEIMDT